MFQARRSIDQVFEKLQEDPENCVCVDCGAPNPVFVSVSHGAFVCPVCVNFHDRLGAISATKSILRNDWSVYELKKLIASGGNSALKEFIDHYQLAGFAIETKYRTKALSVYRRMLNEITNERGFDEELPSVEVGKEPETHLEPQGWFGEMLKRSKTLGSKAWSGIVKGVKEKGLKTSEMLGEVVGEVRGGFVSGTIVIKNETFMLVKELEQAIRIRGKGDSR